MGEKFTLIENNTLFEFEYNENRLIYLLNYELKDSKINHNDKKTQFKNIESAKISAREMLTEMGIIN